MTGDPENDNDGADDRASFEPQQMTGEQEGDPAFRPFRAWASAYEPDQSLLERMRSRLSSFFRRKSSVSVEDGYQPVAQVTDVAEQEAGPEEMAELELYDAAEDLSDISHAGDVSAVPVAPPRDFQFPWTRKPVENAPAEQVATELSDNMDVEQAFDSMDDALPAAEVPAEPIAKRGLFSRIFGKTPAATPESDALEIEVHEDRIEAAAQALDDVGVDQFESFEGSPATFDSVEQALPVSSPVVPPALPPIYDEPASAELALDGLPIVGDFAPPEPVDLPALEIEEKTDEFEIAALEAPTDPTEIEPSSTLELDRKSIWNSPLLRRFFKRGDTQIEQVGADDAHAAQSAKFLLAKFRAFYSEIIRFQHQKSEFSAGFATAILAEVHSDVEPDAAAESLSKRLTELLELQAAEAKWMGGEAAERYPDAQFAMAALADELCTHSEWVGQTAWPKHSIERKLHRSRDAELEVFRRIDKLLKEAPDTTISRDLARVYLLVLAAGFQGKWRPFELTRPLAEYRRRLYEYIYDTDPLMLYSSDRKVFPEAASRTLEGHAVSRFTAAQRWAAILAFLMVSYTVVAHIAWNRVSADLKDVTTRIKSGSPVAGAP